MSNWMVTILGGEHHMGMHEAGRNKIDLDEIAHALAQINRFTGHCIRPYSVAEHSLLVCEIAERMGASKVQQICALLHDAHEAYTGDVSSPAKMEVGPSWGRFEDAHERAVHRHFGLLTAFKNSHRQLRHWDLIALATERRDLTNYIGASCRPWPILDTPGEVVPPAGWLNLDTIARAAMPWTVWRDRFLEKAAELFDGLELHRNPAA